MFHGKNMRALLVKLRVEDRDKFGFGIKQLNWDSYLERCVKGVRQYIVNDDFSTLSRVSKRYEMQIYKQQTTLPWLNTADRNKGQMWTTYSVTYLYIHIIKGHYFIHPVPLLTLCRYFNVCVRSGQSPAIISVPLTVQHSQHIVYSSVSRQFNSHLFCFYVSL